MATNTRAIKIPDLPQAQPLPQKREFPWKTVAILLAIMLLYSGSPIDLIPDFIPLLGWLDDLVVDGGLVALIIRTVVRHYFSRK